MDLRSGRTIQWIKEAFIRLVNEEGFVNVTVSQISEEAQINRRTFYSHFQDKYDLAEIIANDVITHYQNIIQLRFSDDKVNISELIVSFLAEDERPVLQALFSIHTKEFDFERTFSEKLIQEVKVNLAIQDPLAIEIYIAFALTTVKYYLTYPEETFSLERQEKIITQFQNLL